MHQYRGLFKKVDGVVKRIYGAKSRVTIPFYECEVEDVITVLFAYDSIQDLFVSKSDNGYYWKKNLTTATEIFFNPILFFKHSSTQKNFY